jgi:hypothetical protein
MKNKKYFLEFELFRFFSSFLVAALKTYSQENFVDLRHSRYKNKIFCFTNSGVCVSDNLLRPKTKEKQEISKNPIKAQIIIKIQINPVGVLFRVKLR